MATLIERAKEAARAGYALSENIYARGLYEVRRPDGRKYTIDATEPAATCNCQASVVCKHIGLLEQSRRFWLALDRKAAAARVARRRTRFSAKHIATFRALAPVMAGPKPAAKTAPARSPEQIALRQRVEARMESDFS